MGLSEILGLIIIILLLAVLILQIAGRKKSDSGEIMSLLRHNAEEQRDAVQKQIARGTTEQFERFGFIQKSVQDTLSMNRNEVNRQLGEFQRQMETKLTEIQKTGAEGNEQIGNTVRTALQKSREEQNNQLHTFGEQVEGRLSSMQRVNAENIEKINTTLENKMKELQESNEKRLEQMQGVVDEKLQKTLETRLSQSFELVSKQLESVGQGLGEMKALAADAKSLKNALTNVKQRGTYGEVRLEKLLSDILAPNQYEMNVEIANGKRVEFAVKLPGNGDVPLLLPIDSKFPIEDYNRLLDAEDKQAIDEARRSLTAKIRAFAKDIHDKYIVPPKTTDFALMFLPTEGLYAEVVQNAALFEELRDKYKITAVGATTLSAFLASLQMGFKTLAIEQRSQEVWDTLRAVKSEFIKFGDMLDKAQKQLQTADKTLTEIVGRRTKAINRTLRGVEELTDVNAPLLQEPEDAADE
ncbi:MAG: DNA recombination protein RmuC [Clostridium sp.]|nr:DNA recombination protein RmuC [Acetatifactor muris]MCM1527223.1 DNA recombination protein RmuC [Bacteroides sp.]MCM1562452.1 DNA recombination protein RmuC [Clostridium sp.]